MYTAYSKKMHALQRCVTGSRIYSFDVNASGAKKFIVTNPATFLEMYLALKPERRVYYEMIPDGVPIKLYMDFEFKRRENPGLNENEMIEKIISGVRTAVKIPDVTPLQLDSSNEIKASRHLIFPIVFKTKADVKAFVIHLVNELKSPETDEGNVCGLDLSVYDKQRFFRMIGSHKFAEPLRKLCAIPTQLLDKKTVCDSMISVFKGCDADDGSLPFTETVRIQIDFAKPVKRRVCRKKGGVKKRLHVESEPLNETHCSIMASLTKWVNEKYPALNRKVYGELYDEETLSLTLSPGVYCPHAKRVHKSNCSWLNVHLIQETFQLRCADPDCKGQSSWCHLRIKDVVKER